MSITRRIEPCITLALGPGTRARAPPPGAQERADIWDLLMMNIAFTVNPDD
jgi:hypothetical protein